MFKYFRRSEYFRNVFTLMSGAAIAQAIPLLISPVLSRLYTPEEFGAFAFYMSIVGAFAIIATLRYEMAVIMPKDDADAVNIAGLAFLVDIFLSLCLLIAIIILEMTLLEYFSISHILKIWLYFLPLFVFLIGSVNIFQHWFNRNKRYKGLALAKVINSLGNNVTILLLGFAGAGAWGLLIGNMFGLILFNAFFIIKIYVLDRNKFKFFNKTSLRPLAKKYKDLPIANTPQSFSEMLQMNGIIYLLKIFFNSTVIGWYSFSLRILQAPMWLVVTSIAQVFYKEASEKYNTDSNILPTVTKTIKITAVVGLPVLLVLLLAGPWIFALVFGEPWREAGVYARILAPWMYFDFIRYSIAQAPLIVSKIKPMFFLSLIGTTFVILSLTTGAYVFGDVRISFVFLSSFMAVYDIGIILWILKIVRT
ncbi:MAG: oligosaccharide flippase family protein [Bacteroidetes bacterium]|nr:oligosaccharide flippase family protein [Bacteroidota bacterium]